MTVENNGLTDLAVLCNQREALYVFLASSYEHELTEEQIVELSQRDLPQEDSLVGKGYSLIHAYLAKNRRFARTELAVDYARLFLGAGVYEGRSAAPYESVYTSEERLLMQDARDEVVAVYREWGLDVPAGTTVPEDHLSFELSFMSALCQQASHEFEKGALSSCVDILACQKSFLEQHMLRWVPDLCKDIRELGQTDYYHGIADITEGFLRLEQDVVGDLLDVCSEG